MTRGFFVVTVLLAAVSLNACASTSGASAGGSTTAAPASGYGFVVSPMAIVPPTPPSNGFVATALQADGRTGVGTDHFGRVERDRVIAENGQVLLQLNPDGTLVLPWSTASDGPRFRLTAQGMEAVNRGVTTNITVNDQGEYSENGTPTGARVTPYTPAHRDTALLLRVLHAIAFMHGMATTHSTAVTPAS